ncbi:hypothetical protein DXH95_13175 [Sphingorhabdus pulchriflava]|uniref:Uncharacterized protein n=1 Tax=Sphingorhabdus pulchriflava TaxID=2292257 RepID=A0A371B5P3_9SPHN|nr:hypothetical protein [Sphingorhabdus pulchriflava]RDV02874.1 hypothetical protein DXH95_13175 [Sphingorhabdus pulchriflava]
MKYFLKFVLACSVVGSGPVALGQPSGVITPTEQVAKWCSQMVASKGSASFLTTMRVSSLVVEQKAMITALDSQQALINSRYGLPHSCETIDVSKVGARVETHRILLHHEKSASTWEFRFYDGNQSWEVINFWFRDEVIPKKSEVEEQ